MSGFTFELPEAAVDAIAARVADRLAAELAAAREPESFIGVDEAAAFIAAPRSRIYDLCAQGFLPHCRDGRRVLLRKSDLTAYLLAHRNGGS